MRVNKALQHALAATIGLALYAAAYADNCTGRVNNVAISSETIEVAKGHTMAIFVAHSVTTSENSPHNNVGKCGGYAITTPDGKTRLVGVCARKSKDADSFSDEWVLEAGAERGTWRQIGGTGIFAGKKSSGWFQPISDDGKVYMGRWGGNCD